MSGKTEVNLEDMTVEEFLSKKTRDVEETIINHAKDMCGMIMRQYEEARNKELGRFENPPPARVDMIVTLKCTKGPHVNHIFVIKPKSKVYPIIGRSSSTEVMNNGVSLPNDREVSSYHGKFFIRGGQLKYKDTTSLNHSYVNGELVDDDVTLKSGDILHVGQSELLVEISK
ncbi:hypothetical protein WA538_001490 [Blastocystis sp. DL]